MVNQFCNTARRAALAAIVAGVSFAGMQTVSADEFLDFLSNAQSIQLTQGEATPAGEGVMPAAPILNAASDAPKASLVAPLVDSETKAMEPSQTPQSAGESVEEASDGEADESDEEKKDLSEQIKAFQERLDEMESSIEGVADKAGNKSIVVSGSSKSTMKVSGRIHVDAWGFDSPDVDEPTLTRFNDGLDPKNRLGFRRIRFGVKGNIKDNMLYKIEMEFANGNDSEFRDVYLGWADLPVLQQVLVGNQKRPYGLDHLNSSRFNVFIERPFVIEAFNEDARRLGIASYGVSEDQKWNWRYGVYNQRNIQSLGNYIDDHLQLQIAGRLANTIWYDEVSDGRGYAHWAVSGTHADSTSNTANGNEARFRTRPEARSSNRWLNTDRIDNADHYELIGFEGVVNVGALQVVGEYQSVSLSRDTGVDDLRFDGGYVYLSYFLTGEHMPWDRKSGTIGRIVPHQNFWIVDKCDGCRDAGWGAWQLAARYSQADFSDDDILGGEGEALTIGLNWYWNSNARVQFNYIAGEIDNRDAGAGVENAAYDIYGARFSVDF